MQMERNYNGKKRNESTSTLSLFEYLRLFYNEHKRVIRQDYKDLTKKILSHANPANANSYLRTPQYEAFEMYVFLKEYLNNPKLGDLFENWCNNKGRFSREVYAKPSDYETSSGLPEISESPETVRFLWC